MNKTPMNTKRNACKSHANRSRMYGAKDLLAPGAETDVVARSFSEKDVVDYQREYFALLEDAFKRILGKNASDFATPNDFIREMKKSVKAGRRNISESYGKAFADIHDFYAKHSPDTFDMPKSLHGMKLVLGGTSRFTPIHLGALRRTMLYADTFLIPDPVLPWLEDKRDEERFHYIEPLIQMHSLLRLKPLVDTDLPYPAIAVFPSFERLLMKRDSVTMDGFGGLLMDFFGHYLDAYFEDETEIERYILDNEGEFLRSVEEKSLFIAPNQEVGAPLKRMLDAYRGEIQNRRSDEHIKAANSAPDGILVFQGIIERLQPQYHLRENADELGAQPMLCLDAHAHYFKLCADIFSDTLLGQDIISGRSLAALRALENPKFKWLTNIPFDVLAKLRSEGENEIFRRRIGEYVGLLHESKLNDLDKVAYEVDRGIQSLLKEHDQNTAALERKYKQKFKSLAVTGWIGVAASFYPALAPYLGTVTIAAIAKGYLSEKINQLRESNQISRSLTGVIAKAKGNIPN